MSVWDRLVGQPRAVAELQETVHAAALGESAMKGGFPHAWLITGPAGSGRSVAAKALASALVCADDGCGVCSACREVAENTHPDVVFVKPVTLSHSKATAHDLVRQASVAPALSHWRVLIVEDADRLTEPAANALLKAIEEPPPGVVWILCAPSTEDVLATIRSRTRHLAMQIPDPADVAEQLVQEGVDQETASLAASAAVGHVGRARALANDPQARELRQKVVNAALTVRSLPEVYQVAAALIDAAKDSVKVRMQHEQAAQEEQILSAYGEGAEGVSSAKVKGLARGAMSELAKRLKSQESRMLRDEVDRYLSDIESCYRDVLLLQVQATTPLANQDFLTRMQQVAAESSEQDSVHRLEAVGRAKVELAASVPPQLVCEALFARLSAALPMPTTQNIQRQLSEP